MVYFDMHLKMDCNDNDEFCKSVKNFIMLLQLATLSVTAADTVSSWALRRSAKKVIDNAGGEAQLEAKLENLNAGGDNTYLSEAAQKIKSCAIVPISIEKIKEIINGVKNAINKANLDKIGNPFSPPKFSISHWNDSEMEEFIKFANDQGLTQKDIETFLFISGRKRVEGKDFQGNRIEEDKSFGKQEAMDRINNVINVVKPRKYPFGFANLSKYEISKDKLKYILEEANLSTDNVYLGGSSLQKIDPGDCDIYIFVTEEKLDQIGENIIKEAERLKEMAIIDKELFKEIRSSVKSSIKNRKLIYGDRYFNTNGIGVNLEARATDFGVLSSTEPGAFPDGIEIIIKVIDDSSLYMKIEF